MSALAFNAKLLIDFTYNSGATSIFTITRDIFPGYSGDLFTNSLTAEKADVNRRAVILGRTLGRAPPRITYGNPHCSQFPITTLC